MPKGTDSTTKFKADITDFKAAMQEAARYVRLANSEFKEASAGLGKWSDSADGLSAKIKQLNKVLDAEKRQLDVLESEYEKVAKEQGENSKGAEELKIRINNQRAAIIQTESQLTRYSDKLEEVSRDSEDMGDSVQDSSDQAKKAADGFTVMKGALADLVADGIRMTIDALKDLAKETYNAGANFESAMSQVEAVSGATASEVDALTQKAKEMGESTKFSATESAEAFNYMAMAGWKTQDMIDGIGGIMNLAAASGADLATTSDIVTDALTAMGYGAKDAGRLADVMAAASSNANTNVEMMGATFQYAAPIVGALGYSMEDTAVAIGLMANAGIKGDKAGTALRSTLTRLSAPPKECAEAMDALNISITDSNGEMKPFSKVIDELRKKFKNLSNTQQTQYAKALAGQEAMSGLLAIVNAAPEDFDKLTKAVQDSNGAAQDMADTMNDNVAGQMTLLHSKIEGIMIQIFERLAPSIRDAIDEISESLDKVDWDNFADGVGNFAKKLIELFAFITRNGPTILSILKSIAVAFITYKTVTTVIAVYSAFTSLFALIKGGTAIVAAFNTTLGLSPVGLVAAAVAGLTIAMVEYTKSVEKARQKEWGLTNEQKNTIESVKELSSEYEQMDKARKDSMSNIDAEYGHIKELKTEYNSLIKSNGKVKKGYEDRANFIINQLAKSMGVEREEIEKLINKNGKLGKSIDDLILKKQAEASLNANEGAYQKAIENRDKALQNYQKTAEDVEKAQEKLTKAEEERQKIVDKMNNATRTNQDMSAWSFQLSNVEKDVKTAKKALEEEQKALKDSENTYVGYVNTITNYEGVSAAVLSGDAKEIKTTLTNLQNDFITAKNGTSNTLQQQVKDYEKNYKSLQDAVKKGMAGVSKEDIDSAKKMLDKSRKELINYFNKSDIVAEAKKSGVQIPKALSEGIKNGTVSIEKATKQVEDAVKFNEMAKNSGAVGKDTIDKLSSAILNGEMTVDDAVKQIKTSAETELKKDGGEEKTGETFGKKYATGITNQTEIARNAGKELPKEAKKGADTKDETTNPEPSGKNFAQGFINGMGSLVTTIWNKGKELAKKALGGLKEGQKEGSPSKLTTQSGVYFGEGFNNGINSMIKTVVKSAENMGIEAVKSLRDAQEENSPSKLTYKSGVNFTKGYIKGISSMEKGLVKTVKGLVTSATKELLKLNNFNFAEVGQKASNVFSEGIASKIEYTNNKIAYQNEKKLADFDKTIASLESKRDKKLDALEKKKDKAKTKKEKNAITKQINATKKEYTKLINTQEKYKEAYQTASSAMLSEFSDAMSEYQSKAQELIDSTINGVTETYQAKYDALINKQDSLIEKMKSAGNLFEISGAGVITVNDIKEQTKQIKDYADKLKTIKSKVSSDLFDQIASYDMKEGQAFINQLLGMSDAELKAYDEAYTEKMSLAENLSKDLYKEDFKQVEKDYKDAINKAMGGLPKQLEDLGTQAMKGFVSGLTTNTDYLDKNVKTFVKGMVNTFKKELKIKSPSKVMMTLGEFTGEGFGDGLKSMVGYVQGVASDIVDATTTSLDGVKTNLGDVKSTVGGNVNGLPATSSTVVNNYNLTQNNTSPKSLSALETYQARRQQIAMIKAATQNA